MNKNHSLLEQFDNIPRCPVCGTYEGYYHDEDCDLIGGIGNYIFFYKPNICARCGKLNPEIHMVDDEKWRFIIGVTYNYEDILCKECMNMIYMLRVMKHKDEEEEYQMFETEFNEG